MTGIDKGNSAQPIHQLQHIYVTCSQEERTKAYRREKRKDRKRKAQAVEEDQGDSDIAAMMGFGGFGSSKKR